VPATTGVSESQLAGAAVVDFPLRGEWRALQTPADRVPSHGTDYLGQRYAFDFVQLDPGTNLHYRRGVLRHFFGAQPADRFFCWNQPIYSAFPGTVIAARDGWPDRMRVNFFRELLRPTFADVGPDGDDLRPLTGNYVMVKGEPGVALYAHLRNGSVTVRDGQQLSTGDSLGTVGNSGNSTVPHLHFHLMDSPDSFTASGVLCAFRGYERHDGKVWLPVDRGLPGALERVRSAPGR
jgi:hypothetical protein